MDVVAMFPNLQHEGVARTCREEFLKSDLTIEEVDTKALGIYIAILYQDRKEELEALSLSQVVLRRVHLRAKKILITTEEVLEPGESSSPGNSCPLRSRRCCCWAWLWSRASSPLSSTTTTPLMTRGWLGSKRRAGPLASRGGGWRVEGGGGARVVCTEEGGRVESEVLGGLGLNFPCGMMKCKIV